MFEVFSFGNLILLICKRKRFGIFKFLNFELLNRGNLREPGEPAGSATTDLHSLMHLKSKYP